MAPEIRCMVDIPLEMPHAYVFDVRISDEEDGDSMVVNFD